MVAHRGALRGLIEWLAFFIIACIVMLLVRTFVIEFYRVPSASMEPTILIGDQLIGEKVSLELGRAPSVGDVVVFQNPDETSDHDILVKRVIATGGQTVDLRYGQVYVDGTLLDEPYASGSTYPLAQQLAGVTVTFPYTVPEGMVWVMGDNRENSADSRYFGAVSEDSLEAIVLVRYWPIDRIGLLE